jgi:hypothetical protein
MLCVPSVPGRLFGNALWSVIWPKLISDLAGYKYKARLDEAVLPLCLTLLCFIQTCGIGMDDSRRQSRTTAPPLV